MLKAFESELFLNNHILALSPEPTDKHHWMKFVFSFIQMKAISKFLAHVHPLSWHGRMGIYIHKNVKTHSLNNS